MMWTEFDYTTTINTKPTPDKRNNMGDSKKDVSVRIEGKILKVEN